MIEHFIYSLLSNDPDTAELVSGRIYPLIMPQNAIYPCLTYSADQDAEDSTFDGQGSFGRVTIEVDCWAGSHAGMITLGDTVKAAMKNYAGTITGVAVDAIRIESVVSVYEDLAEKYRRTIIATIHKR